MRCVGTLVRLTPLIAHWTVCCQVESLKQQHTAELSRLRDEHAAEIEGLKQQHAAEIESVKRDRSTESDQHRKQMQSAFDGELSKQVRLELSKQVGYRSGVACRTGNWDAMVGGWAQHWWQWRRWTGHHVDTILMGGRDVCLGCGS